MATMAPMTVTAASNASALFRQEKERFTIGRLVTAFDYFCSSRQR